MGELYTINSCKKLVSTDRRDQIFDLSIYLSHDTNAQRFRIEKILWVRYLSFFELNI